MTELQPGILRDIKLVRRIIEWMEVVHRGGEQQVRDFIHTVYGGRPSEGYINEKCEKIEVAGVWHWMGSLDSTNLHRFYNLIINEDPTEWWEGYHEAQDRMVCNGPTPEDLGAEPREPHEAHFPASEPYEHDGRDRHGMRHRDEDA